MQIIGHRGAKGLAPENSALAIRRALACNVDMIEVDVRVQNGVLVLSHDATLSSEKYETLQHALTIIRGKVPLNLEIKEPEVVPLLKSVLKDYKGKLLFSSFFYPILKTLRRDFPDTELAVLEKWSGVRAVAEASLLGVNRIHVNQQWLWSGFVRSMKHRGYELYAYTVNSRDRAEELEEWGVDGIFTDYPSLFTRS